VAQRYSIGLAACAYTFITRTTDNTEDDQYQRYDVVCPERIAKKEDPHKTTGNRYQMSINFAACCTNQ
ncbi:hypothetical protein QP220_10935, partial [Actinotignum timonense]